jgi:predicted short-subunit dehydrogenase-like oxidoreductase (DUF2520 family)
VTKTDIIILNKSDVFFACKRIVVHGTKQPKKASLFLAKALELFPRIFGVDDFMKIGFIGAGKAGKALGRYFKNHEVDVAGYYSRTFASAQDAAQNNRNRAFHTVEELADGCDLLFITASDQALPDIAGQVAQLISKNLIAADKIWVHVSGALPSSCLAKISQAGGFAGSMHPLLSFGDPGESAAMLEKVFFSIEGSEQAVKAIIGLLTKTRGRFCEIKVENKPLYHAGACVISNYMTTMIDTGMRYLEAAGMERETLLRPSGRQSKLPSEISGRRAPWTA